MDDREFLRAFEAAAIPSERWAHRDHVRMAFLYLRDHPFEQALEKIRSGIRALNRANGGVDTPTSGYHETLTVAWARVIAAALAASGMANRAEADSAQFIAAHPELLAKGRLLVYYSRDLMMGMQARANFVPPDLAELPELPISAIDAQAATVDSLLRDLLDWLGPDPRPYAEVMAAWRTSCPRLPVWEEAMERRLIAREQNSDGVPCVVVTAAGHAFSKRGPSAAAR